MRLALTIVGFLLGSWAIAWATSALERAIARRFARTPAPLVPVDVVSALHELPVAMPRPWWMRASRLEQHRVRWMLGAFRIARGHDSGRQKRAPVVSLGYRP